MFCCGDTKAGPMAQEFLKQNKDFADKPAFSLEVSALKRALILIFFVVCVQQLFFAKSAP